MDARTLAAAMGTTRPLADYERLAPAFNAAMLAASCTTVRRAAMWCAQLGHESNGLKWMEELASGDAYEGRRDLGNTEPGDGRRFKGHGPIQITGRHNHAQVSAWAHRLGYTAEHDLFVREPWRMADEEYGFLGAVWYWTVARPRINEMADRMDIAGVTRAINGGLNGLGDRLARYDRCLKLGTALLPEERAMQFINSEGIQVGEETVLFWLDKRAKEILDQHAGPGRTPDGSNDFSGWPQLGNRTLVNALAAIGEKLGIEGFTTAGVDEDAE